MSIDFHFCDSFGVFTLKKKINSNKECVKKVINAFNAEEILIFEHQNILFFFDDKQRINDSMGSLIFRGSFDYAYFKKEFSDEINKISKFSDFEFIIYISENTAEIDSEIFKSLTIAHELQHILQEVYIKCIILKDTLLKKYLRLKNLYSPKEYRNLPTEIDAFIKAKKITINLFSEREVNDFLNAEIAEIDSRISNTRDSVAKEKLKGEKEYWEDIKNIDISMHYELEDRFEELWDKYQCQIEEEFTRINERFEENEIDFYQAYSLYKNKCNS